MDEPIVRVGFTFGGPSMTLRAFLETHEHRLPVVLLVHQGYLGCDENMHAFSNDEVYLIYTVKKQPRVILRDAQKRNIAIPAHYSGNKFQLVAKDGTLSDPILLSSILEKMVKQGFDPQIIFENNQRVGFQLGANTGDSQKLGQLHYHDKYEEKYLVCFTIFGLKNRADIAIPMPVYLELDVRVATAVSPDSSKTSLEEMIRSMTPEDKAVDLRKVATCQEIIILPAHCGPGDYEYVKHDKERYVTLCPRKSQKTVSKYEQIQVPQNRLTRQDSKPVKSAAVEPPALQPHQQNRADIPSGQLPDKRESSSSKRGSSTRRPLPPEPGDTGAGTTSSITSVPEEEESYSLSGLTTRSYSDLNDVPPNVSTLTAAQVAECLSLLKLGATPCKRLVAADVDGQLLQDLGQEVLVSDFYFKQFDAIKLRRFVKGWRPKH